MEYEIDNESKYTTLQIRAMLVWKDMNKKLKKGHWRKSPHGGMGNRLERAYSKNIFIIIGYNLSKLKYQKLLGPYTGWNEDLTTLQKF